MLAPIFQDVSFSLDWMSRNRILKDALTQGVTSVSAQSTADGEPLNSSQVESSDTVNAGAESSQTKSSNEESDSSKELEKSAESGELTTEEKHEVSQLQTIDRNVRAHEQAHLNAAQGIAVSGADYKYHIGPDDKRYAVAGEVTIDTSKENEPEKTINKGYRIIRTALAPTDPSPQDLSVAASAEQMILEAQAELMRESYAVNRQNDAGQRSGEIIDQQV